MVLPLVVVIDGTDALSGRCELLLTVTSRWPRYLPTGICSRSLRPVNICLLIARWHYITLLVPGTRAWWWFGGQLLYGWFIYVTFIWYSPSPFCYCCSSHPVVDIYSIVIGLCELVWKIYSDQLYYHPPVDPHWLALLTLPLYITFIPSIVIDWYRRRISGDWWLKIWLTPGHLPTVVIVVDDPYRTLQYYCCWYLTTVTIITIRYLNCDLTLTLWLTLFGNLGDPVTVVPGILFTHSPYLNFPRWLDIYCCDWYPSWLTPGRTITPPPPPAAAKPLFGIYHGIYWPPPWHLLIIGIIVGRHYLQTLLPLLTTVGRWVLSLWRGLDVGTFPGGTVLVALVIVDPWPPTLLPHYLTLFTQWASQPGDIGVVVGILIVVVITLKGVLFIVIEQTLVVLLVITLNDHHPQVPLWRIDWWWIGGGWWWYLLLLWFYCWTDSHYLGWLVAWTVWWAGPVVNLVMTSCIEPDISLPRIVLLIVLHIYPFCRHLGNPICWWWLPIYYCDSIPHYYCYGDPDSWWVLLLLIV